MIKCYTVLMVATLFFLSPKILLAGTTGKISGKVTDAKTGEGIPSAVVTVVGTTLGAAADANGAYVIVNVPPGTYTVSVSYIGYQPTRVNNVGVNVDYTTTLNIQLRESSVELGEVVVEGERNPLIRQDQTNPVVAVTSESFQTLPVTTISEVIGLQAGVVTSDDGLLHIRGGRSNEIAYTLNGISVNNPYDNFSSIGVATNAVQEVTVSTGTFSAEYGNALSGVVNYVTKEGGQRTSGSFRLLTGDYYTKNETVFPHLNKYQPFNTSRAEITLGGPFILDDLSFYVSGVFDRNNGYLYGNRIYRPSDMSVQPSEFTKTLPVLDSLGNLYSDPNTPGQYVYTNDWRFDGRTNAPYFFNPLGGSIKYFTAYIKNSNGQFDKIQVPYANTDGLPTGDSALVPLNTSRSYNIQGNISYRLSSTMKIKYELVYDNGESKDAYYYSYRYNPDGRPTNYSNGIVQTLDWTHTLSNAAFYTVKLSLTDSHDKTYTYENINDPRYLPSFYQSTLINTSFLTGGVYLGRTFRSTKSMGAKVDVQAQMFEDHEVKFGGELRLHTLNLESYTLEFYNVKKPSVVIDDFQDVYADSMVYAARVPGIDGGYTRYTRKPAQLSLYVQDKIELEKSFILNAGVRYEYFDPSARYNPNLSDEYSNLGVIFVTKGLKPASIKHTFSPRISMAYPITDQGVIRFSYGHFYQLGNLSSLYRNPNFRATGTPTFGNADVRPQKSVQYEVGLTQGLTPDFRLEVVAFYKDVRDYLYSQTVKAGKGDIEYVILTNLDYANSRGLTISLYQRRAPGSIFSSSVDYTFAVAEGNRTEPVDELFYNELSQKAAETFLVPLDFDRTHTLNTTLNLTEPDDYSISSTIRLQTGSPYTPSIPASLSTQISRFIQNSSSKPFQWSVDLKVEKFFALGGLRYSVFALVDNLFNTENEIAVYSNSGKALYNANQVADPTAFQDIRTRITRGDAGLIPLSAIDNYYANPQNLSRPRLVRFGISMLF
jgi:outer membrane receptor protein involved in Fe transport